MPWGLAGPCSGPPGFKASGAQSPTQRSRRDTGVSRGQEDSRMSRGENGKEGKDQQVILDNPQESWSVMDWVEEIQNKNYKLKI